MNKCDNNGVKVRNIVSIKTSYGDCELVSFRGLADDKEHLAVVYNNAMQAKEPLVRIHSECLTGDVFQSEFCDCGEQLDEAKVRFSKNSGIILYLRQEGRGIGLYNKIDAYELQKNGLDTYEANNKLNFKDDLRDYKVAVQMLEAMNINRISLLTNNPEKVKKLQDLGINVVERISTGEYIKKSNIKYLYAKKNKSNHFLALANISL